MAIKLNSSNLFSDNNAAITPTRTERPQAQVWANIGFRATINDENGEQKEVFIQMPYGVPVDTMNELDVPRKDSNYKDMVSAGNELLQKLRKIGLEKLGPGDTTIIKGLEVQLVRRHDEAPVPSNNIIVPDFG